MALNLASIMLGVGIGLGGMLAYYYVIAPQLGLPTFRVGHLISDVPEAW